MKFCWCTISVKNMQESLNFYNDVVGLSMCRKFKAGPSLEIAFLGDGETKLELICDTQTVDITIGNDISCGFTVTSADEKIAELKEKGISIHSGPFQPNPHIKYFYVLDPNGLKIQFVEESGS